MIVDGIFNELLDAGEKPRAVYFIAKSYWISWELLRGMLPYRNISSVNSASLSRDQYSNCQLDGKNLNKNKRSCHVWMMCPNLYQPQETKTIEFEFWRILVSKQVINSGNYKIVV